MNQVLVLSVFKNQTVFTIYLLFFLNSFFVILLTMWFFQRRQTAALNGLHEITHIWNRASFIKTAETMLKDSDRSYAVLHIDILRFHTLNDIYGYHTADQILRLFANLLKTSFCRSYGICCTLWADRHAVLIEYHSKEQLEQDYFVFCQKFQARVQKICDTGLIIKGGVCISKFCQQPHTDIRELLKFAENASKTLEQPTENSLSWYTTKLAKSNEEHSAFEAELSDAFLSKRFHSYYQPKYDLYTGAVVGAEALIRWIHDERGVIMPLRFLPDLEKNGSIIDVDLYVFEEVCSQMSSWLKNGMMIVPVSCNFSSLHFQNPVFPELLHAITEKYLVPPDLFEIEIKENAAVSQLMPLSFTADRLKSYGFRIAIDGFGADYMSLQLLYQFPVDIIKLDKSLLTAAPLSDHDRIILHSIILLAQKLNISVICEGVESEAQVEYLKLAGCRKAQGFYYEAPLPVGEFEKRLAITHSLPSHLHVQSSY